MSEQINKVLLEHAGEFDPAKFNIKRIKGMLGRGELDLEPMYQRGNVWEWSARQSLILSLFYELPIGCLNLVKKRNWHKDEYPHYYVMDAKQRLTTIQWFFFPHVSSEYQTKQRKELTVPLKTNKGITLLTWRDIEVSTDPFIERARERFLGHELTAAIWSWMPIKIQSQICKQVNYSAAQKPAERNYCINFLSKLLLTHIHKVCVIDYISKVETPEGCVQGNVISNYRFEGLRFVHQVMLLAFGKRFDHLYAPCDSGQAKLEQSAEQTHNSLSDVLEGRQIDFDDLREIPLDIIESAGFSPAISLFKKTCHRFQEILEFDIQKSSIIHDKNLVSDILVFLLWKQQQGILTPSLIRTHRKEMLNWIIEYHVTKNNKENSSTFKAHTTIKKMHEFRFNFLGELFEEIMPFDLKIKNQSLSSSVILKARLDSTGKCPGCGSDLTINNKRDDHKSPKSKYGETEAQVLCDPCNAKKGNLDKSDLEQLRNICS